MINDYIITVILLITTLIIVIYYTDNEKYLYDIFNNIKNKFTHLFNNNSTQQNIISSNERDGLLFYLKKKLNVDEIKLPKNLSFTNDNDKLISKNIEIHTRKYSDNKEYTYNIDIFFIINNNDTFISEYYLYNINGNFDININNNDKPPQPEKTQEMKQVNNNLTDTFLNEIPDYIEISSEENTTATPPIPSLI
jgi:hypothetical protein